MVRIAELIDTALTNPDDESLSRIKGEVEDLTSAFPLYQSKRLPSRVRRSA
jgi:glycine/serine hydroxymethyltransferase